MDDYYRSRLFCFILTSQSNLENRSRAIYETWGHRCGRFVFITRLNSSTSYTIYDNQYKYLKEDQLPIQYIPTLPNKVRSTLLFLNKYYSNYDWYLKADDDTYIIVENLLRFLVSTIKRRPKPVLYGYRFREDYYVSGGGGYVLIRKGLNLFGSYINNDSRYFECKSPMEDIMVGSCFKRIFEIAPKDETKDLITVGETIDDEGRERFHPQPFRVHFNGPLNKIARYWIYDKAFHHNLFGYESISETTISFHYTQPEDMYQMDSLLYHIREFDKEVCLSHS
ncbi:unnamed protein product [Rotaria sordida]|uniref:N-acetylgalactosaminide beta-1,3-galactosyltransferase n=2 Tax=Rotaria sordida TaxID=392033 RepID=A0A819NEU8_9BILA|nr:unnamed protein product [Rotaria sordida]